MLRLARLASSTHDAVIEHVTLSIDCVKLRLVIASGLVDVEHVGVCAHFFNESFAMCYPARLRDDICGDGMLVHGMITSVSFKIGQHLLFSQPIIGKRRTFRSENLFSASLRVVSRSMILRAEVVA